MTLCVTAGCSAAGDKATGAIRPVATVEVSAGAGSVLVDATTTFTATALDRDGAVLPARPATWSTSDAAIASITPAGLVTGIAPGQATIRAAIDGVAGSSPITVQAPAVASIEISGSTGVALLPGETLPLTAVAKSGAGTIVTGKTFAWSTSNAAAATVSSDGTVLAVAPGAATISASADGKSGSIAMTVEASALTTIAVTPLPMLVAVGGSYSIAASGADQRGKPVAVQQFTYQSSDQTIATVSADGVVVGVRAGTASIAASAHGVTGATTVTVVAPTSIAGSIVTGNDAALAGMRFTLRIGVGAGTQSFATSVDPSGAFRLDAPLPSSSTDLVDLVFDDDARPRSDHPVAKTVRAITAAAAAARPLLIPESETFTSPTYGTSTDGISLRSAFTRVCTDDTNANCNSFFPQSWLSGLVPLWAASDFPIQLAFDHSSTTTPITSADSVALWTVIHQMEADVGRTLFKPVDFSSLTPPDANGYTPRTVLVWVDNSLSGFAGYTNWIWDANQNIIAAKTRVGQNSYLANRALMSHELLHALGFHHTCAWETVMGGYGCPSAAGITKSDAAAFNMGYQMRAAIVARAPTTDYGDALRGELLLEDASSAALTPLSGAVVRFARAGRGTLTMGGVVVSGDGAP